MKSGLCFLKGPPLLCFQFEFVWEINPQNLDSRGHTPGVPKKYGLLITIRTKVFSLIGFFSVLNKTYPNLDFETKTVQIR